MERIIGALRVPTNQGARGFVRVRYEAYCATCDPEALTPHVFKAEDERSSWMMEHIVTNKGHRKIVHATIVEVCVDES